MRPQKANRILLVVMLLTSSVALAQAPMTSYYDSYDNVTASTDANGNITSVTVTNTLSGYADYTYFSPPYHQGHAYVSFGGVQGFDDSDWVPADYSMYLEASATLNGSASCLTNSSGCAVSESTRVDCSMAGLFYSASGTLITVRIAVATYSLATINFDGTATYDLNCPNGNQHATCGTAHYLGRAPDNWAEEFTIYTEPGGCWFIDIVQLLNGAPAPYNCR